MKPGADRISHKAQGDQLPAAAAIPAPAERSAAALKTTTDHARGQPAKTGALSAGDRSLMADPAAINDAHCSGTCQRSTERPAELKRSLDSRLARIEGQVRGLRRLVEQDAYCDDVLAQVAAARSALANAALLVLEHHMHHCLIDRLQSGDDSIIDELMTTFKRMV